MNRLFPLISLLLTIGHVGGCKPCDCENGDEKASANAQMPQPKAQEARSVVEVTSPALADADADGVHDLRYEPRYRDSDIEELRGNAARAREAKNGETARIRKRQRQERDEARSDARMMVSSLPADHRPQSLDEFKQVPHLKPVRQYRNGTCWSFSTTSLLESEVMRITGKEIRLSEMATVYYEYLAKGRGFVEERGEAKFGQGSQANAVFRIWKERGAWPAEAFPGFVGRDGRHDHSGMYSDFRKTLSMVEKGAMWVEQVASSMMRVILDRDMGSPPATFSFGGKEMTPPDFMKEVLKIDPDDYVSAISTVSIPFYTKGEFEVPDNWWHDKSYHNLPLDEFYSAIKGAIQSGYSLYVGIDISEPGDDSVHDVLFVPDYDIPPGRIDQMAREYRLKYDITTDDHGVHLVGYTERAGHDWFLVKDSGDYAYRGKNKGYYFIRGDYIRLKTLIFAVHKDAISDLLAKFK